MRKYLEQLPEEIQNLIRLAGVAAQGRCMRVYLVGGFVRDLILGVKNLDLDIVVEGDGIAFAEDYALLLKAKLVRHRRFSTATVVISHDLKIDIATARTEYYPKPADLPVVSPGKLEDDLKRRDFTVNAMAIDISPGCYGKLIDCYGGKKDLTDKKIRVLHGLSFVDDPTRILRAVRFEQRYGFRIEPRTLSLARDAVKEGMLEIVQPQRLRDELILILKEPLFIKGVKRLASLTGLKFISPRLSVPAKTRLFLKGIRHEAEWFKSAYPRHRRLDVWIMYLAGLIDHLAPKDARGVCKKFVFSNGETKRILTCKMIPRQIIKEMASSSIKPSRIYKLLEPLSYEAILLLKAKYKEKNIQRHIRDFFDVYQGVRVHVRGEDLLRLGLTPGPQYQKIFSRVLAARLNSEVKTKDDELMLIKRLTGSGR